jgi:CspA family cold shock protein
MAFKDQLVRCGACGTQFVYTVREQRQRKEQGMPLDPPAFCVDCRGADVRLAEAAAPAARRPETAERPRAAAESTRDPGAGPARRSRVGGKPRRDSDRGRTGGGRGRGPRSGDRRGKPSFPRQTELRIRHLGTVKWFDPERGYGFIAQEDGEEVFVHLTGIIAAGEKKLQEGQPVEYEVEHTPRGLQAVDVVPLA